MVKNKIAEVRFKVLQDSTLIDPERQTHISVTGQREHVWKLGLGPCGREVAELDYEITVSALTIRQASYPKGYTEDLERRMNAAMSLPRDAPERKEAFAAYYDLMKSPKVERFIYPLETIVGRIRVLEA